MKKKELLNEIMGVPKSIDKWVDMFSYILIGMAKSIVQNKEIEVSEIKYIDPETKEKKEDIAYRGESNMDGKKVMDWILKLSGYSDLKELLIDPNFKRFPMYEPLIHLSIIFLPDKIWQFEYANKELTNAAHSWDPSTIKKAPFTGQMFEFHVYAPTSWLDNLDTEFFRKIIKPTIAHEMTHAYEVYMRYKGKDDPFMGRETFLNTASKLVKDEKYPQWNEFLHIVYLHLSFEINARITHLYYQMRNKNIKTLDEFMQELKKSDIWQEIKILEDFDADKFINSFKYKDLGLDLLYNLRKQSKRINQGLKPIMSIREPKEGMIQLIDAWDVALQVLNKQISDLGMYKGKLMDLVPPKAKQDPRVFFKFFEQRFHKKAEIFKRKVLRLASLILDEKKMNKS